MTDRADTSKNLQKAIQTAGRIGQTPPPRRRVIAGVTIRSYFTAWQRCYKTPLKNFDFDKMGGYLGVYPHFLIILMI
nr:MAG TPA: hypothetical protein [Caudoviricetes sp.]